MGAEDVGRVTRLRDGTMFIRTPRIFGIIRVGMVDHLWQHTVPSFVRFFLEQINEQLFSSAFIVYLQGESTMSTFLGDCQVRERERKRRK